MKRLLCLSVFFAVSSHAQMMQAIVGASPSGNANGYSKGAVFTFNVHPASNLTAFPNLISGTYAQLADVAHGGYVQHTVTLLGQTVPADLIFTSDSAGTALLSWEIESWNNVTGAIIAWVKSDRLAASDTLIYAWVGKASVTTYQCTASATWNSGYKGIWHFPNSTTLSLLDSTSNGYNLTNNNTVTATTGVIDGAAGKFNGTNQNLSNATFPYSTGVPAITIEYWENQATADLPTGGSAFSIGNRDNPARIQAHSPFADGNIYWDYGDTSAGGRVSTSYVAYLDAWTHVALVYDPTGTEHMIYLNGVPVVSSVSSSVPTDYVLSGITIGGWPGIGLYQKASFDEFRVSYAVRSLDWIAHEYRQQAQASAWYTEGSWGP